jgi:hypothetical protein
MMSTQQPLCLACVHLRPGLTCGAFPDRIPVAILDGRVDHRQPYPGDHGIQFEPLPATLPSEQALQQDDR